MERTINAKQLRLGLPEVVRRVQRGERFTVLYRSRPAFRIIAIGESDTRLLPLEQDPIYRAKPVGRSKDGLTAAEHDAVLYGKR